MKTLIGTIRAETAIQVELTFELQTPYPGVYEAAVLSGFRRVVSTNSAGYFSVSLPAGNYKVTWTYAGVANVGYFTMPDGAGTVDIAGILATTPSNPVTPDIAAATAAALAAAVSAVTHPTSLAAGQHYRYLVGTRAAGVTVTLPDPGSTGQMIEVIDASGQAATWPITVQGGTKAIEPGGPTSYVIDRASAVLTLVYTGSLWKIV